MPRSMSKPLVGSGTELELNEPAVPASSAAEVVLNVVVADAGGS